MSLSDKNKINNSTATIAAQIRELNLALHNATRTLDFEQAYLFNGTLLNDLNESQLLAFEAVNGVELEDFSFMSIVMYRYNTSNKKNRSRGGGERESSESQGIHQNAERRPLFFLYGVWYF